MLDYTALVQTAALEAPVRDAAVVLVNGERAGSVSAPLCRLAVTL